MSYMLANGTSDTNDFNCVEYLMDRTENLKSQDFIYFTFTVSATSETVNAFRLI